MLSHSASGSSLSDLRRSPKPGLIESREDLVRAKRIVIKAGTSVVTNDDGYFSLTRVASLVEQISRLMQEKEGYEVILVSSGATGCGRQKLHKQNMMTNSMSSMLRSPGGSRSAVEQQPAHVHVAVGHCLVKRGVRAQVALVDTDPCPQ